MAKRKKNNKKTERTKKKAALFFYSRKEIFLTVILSAIFLSLAIFFLVEINSPAGKSNAQTEFSIRDGENLAMIARNLKEKQLIKSEFLFKVSAAIGGVDDKLKAGDYLLSPSMSIAKIIRKLAEGKSEINKFTVLEGWTLKDIAESAAGEKFFSDKKFLSLSGSADKPADSKILSKYWFLESDKGISLEGYIFPDTYSIPKNGDASFFIDKALNNFSKKIKPFLPAMKERKKKLRDIIIMASILEKEIKGYEAKQIAAGLLWKRMKNRWPLQVDATANYIVGKKGKLTRKDLNINSPYNTYQHLGLPPGPICNPGLESIKAAIFYKDSPYWFYITTPDGKTIFSRTLQEHNFNSWKYLRNN